MFVSSTFRITGLHNTNGRATLIEAYRCKLDLHYYWITLHLQVSNLK